MKRKIFILIVLSLLFSLFFINFALASGTSIIGKWKTIDDKTNEAKSIVQIYEENGKYYGKITKLFRKPDQDPDPVCEKCQEDDPRKDQPVKGMVIIKDLVKQNGKYTKGTILDPKVGKIYKCSLWLEEGKLMVRGYISFLYRTQVWHRIE